MVRVEAAAGALFFGCHDALGSHDAGATLGSERAGAAYTKRNFLEKPYIICSLYRPKPVPIIYLYYTQRYVYCYVYDCMYLSYKPDFCISYTYFITRSVYTVTYIDVDSLLYPYRNRIKSVSGY